MRNSFVSWSSLRSRLAACHHQGADRTSTSTLISATTMAGRRATARRLATALTPMDFGDADPARGTPTGKFVWEMHAAEGLGGVPEYYNGVAAMNGSAFVGAFGGDGSGTIRRHRLRRLRPADRLRVERQHGRAVCDHPAVRQRRAQRARHLLLSDGRRLERRHLHLRRLLSVDRVAHDHGRHDDAREPGQQRQLHRRHLVQSEWHDRCDRVGEHDRGHRGVGKGLYRDETAPCVAPSQCKRHQRHRGGVLLQGVR